MFCPRCANEVKVTAAYCPHCNQYLGGKPDAASAATEPVPAPAAEPVQPVPAPVVETVSAPAPTVEQTPAPAVTAEPVPAPAPAEKFCMTCGTKLPANAVFCPQCGTKQPPVAEAAPAAGEVAPVAPSAPTQPVQSGKKNKIAIAGFVCAFLLPLLGLILSIVGVVKAKKEYGGKGKKLGIAGIIISAVGIPVSLVSGVVVLWLLMNVIRMMGM